MIHPLFRLCILGTFLLSSYACLENSMQKSIEVVTLSHSGTRINSTLAKSALFGRSDALSMNYSTENMLNNNACDCKKNFSYPDVITNVTEAFNNTLENLVNLQANKNLYRNMGTLIQNVFYQLLLTVNYFNMNKIKASQKNYLQKSDFYEFERNGTEWKYIFASNSACIDYNNTAVSNNVISSLNYCISDERYNKTAAMCVVLKLSQDCSFDVRLQRSRNGPYKNIWDVPCGGLQQHIDYKNGICYNSENKML
ncbi:YBR013C-like protein [Saccharomyces cerevisiae x Saccharomyces kudriavzevii VIN7]|uniref:YBR013C-like protein n=1 Tax=Saccharomyces cerevisiae x Saccharomyces kudriavzevii (strain VIN7) TaxID=1095631 RepID=H0GQX4_SACCK|nr:YBR013C-like protein [Saccharomyces cerevisiae x Saccharomyces kudriavzevii VIN7]